MNCFLFMLAHLAQARTSARELHKHCHWVSVPLGGLLQFVQEDASTPLHFAAAGGEAPRADCLGSRASSVLFKSLFKVGLFGYT